MPAHSERLAKRLGGQLAFQRQGDAIRILAINLIPYPILQGREVIELRMAHVMCKLAGHGLKLRDLLEILRKRRQQRHDCGVIGNDR